MNQYKDLSIKYQNLTDKLKYQRNYDNAHTYSVIYDRLFYQYKEKEVDFLEIGLNFGGNVAICSEYFSKINHYGIDMQDNVIIDKSKFTFYHGSFDDENIVKKVYERKYDIILEDASHILEHQIKSIEIYLPLLKENGIMIIEDVQNMNNLVSLYSKINSETHFSYTIDMRKNKFKNDDILLVIENRNSKYK
jgi:cephalosporin hydroxylase